MSRRTERDLNGSWFHLFPGLVLVLGVALAALGLHQLLPARAAMALGPVVLALLLGLLIANLFALPRLNRPGIRFSYQALLPVAIVLLGASFTFGTALAVGIKGLVMVILLMLFALVGIVWLGRWKGVSKKLTSLIAVGTCVCGNTAVIATAPVIEASDEEVSVALACNTLFGTLAVLLFPLTGHLFHFGDAFFGTWAGTAVNDTSQVMATGFAFSQEAGEIATTIKLSRNALLGFVVLTMGFLHVPSRDRKKLLRRDRLWPQLRKSIPAFVIGFFLMAAANTAGLFETLSHLVQRDVVADFKVIVQFLILMALAGVGLSTNLKNLRKVVLGPLYLALFAATVLSCASLLLIAALGPAGS